MKNNYGHTLVRYYESLKNASSAQKDLLEARIHAEEILASISHLKSPQKEQFFVAAVCAKLPRRKTSSRNPALAKQRSRREHGQTL